VAALALLLAPAAKADRTPLKPGWNFFSPAQDVQIGRQASSDAERQLPMLNDPRVDNYLNALGRRLGAKAPGEPFPYQYKAVNDRAINAFALPGGFIYINRGVIEAADNEAQLAGVMAHETSHVALRHGTNQATKAYATQGLLGILGGAVGGGSVGAIAAQLGAGFVANSVLLKYSRTAESQADILGTQILYDSGYDPRAMAQFFEKIQAESKGRSPAEFFSNHPSPEHREDRVNEEVEKLGGAPPHYKTDSAEFQDIKRYVVSLPAPPKAGARPGSGSRPPRPSDRYRSFQNRELSLQYPDNWQLTTQGDAFTIVPPGGIVKDSRGQQSWAFGIIVNLYEPHSDRAGQITPEEATDQLIDDLRHNNPQMRVVRRHESMRLGPERALSTYLENESPVGGREMDWLVTVMRRDGVLHFICIAPQKDFDEYEPVFQKILDSVRLAS
jgi:hypothetical protein